MGSKSTREASATDGDAPTDRSAFTPDDIVKEVWTGLSLPEKALESLNFEGEGYDYPSSYRIGALAQSTIALSALSVALVRSLRGPPSVPKVTIPLRHALLEFQTERLFGIKDVPPESAWGPIGGLHSTADGHVRIHDNFIHHMRGTLRLLGLDENASKGDVSKKVKEWKKLDLEEAAHKNKLVIYALRTPADWDALPASKAVSNFPILIRKISNDGPKGLPSKMAHDADRCLRGLRVLELSRVIAAPTAGKTLAVHGADVLWVTSPTLPDLPFLDKNLSRGKRTIQLELNHDEDRETLRTLVKDCDVFLQGYRPGSLAARGFSAEDLVTLKPGLIYANLSAFGPAGPWSDRRGFDSVVQTCSGMNVSEAEHYGDGTVARPTPCQALDYAGGYFLATGIAAALYKRATEGGSWEVHVSLAGVMRYLKSLGQRRGKDGFDHADPAKDLPDDYLEERDSGFGQMTALKHAAMIEGAVPGYDFMSKPLGSDEPRWL